MSDTTFTNGVTLTDADWFNDVNRLHYTLFNDPTTTASVASALAPSISSLGSITVTGTLSVSAQAVMASLTVGGTLSLSAGVAGAAVATQANMESAASAGSTSLIVTPGRLQYHPGVAKAWARFDGSATSVTAAAAYNVSSITDNGAGNYTIIFINAFSNGNYAPQISSSLNNSRLVSVSATSCHVTLLDLSGTAADATIVSFVAFGDQ
jgi:hypothetical protein